MNSESKNRARELLAQLTLEEKLYQLSGQMLFGVEADYEQKRNHKEGNNRNPGHFMHAKREKPAAPSEVAERINRDVRLTMDAHPHAILTEPLTELPVRMRTMWRYEYEIHFLFND